MNKYKVGDRVWWMGGKYTIIHIHPYGAIHINTFFCVSADELKPIITCK